MNLKPLIQSSSASEEVKTQALKYVEVIERFAPCEPEVAPTRAYGQAFGVTPGYLKLTFKMPHEKKLLICFEAKEYWLSTWFGIRRVLRFENPTEQDFQKAFEWLKGENNG